MDATKLAEIEKNVTELEAALKAARSVAKEAKKAEKVAKKAASATAPKTPSIAENYVLSCSNPKHGLIVYRATDSYKPAVLKEGLADREILETGLFRNCPIKGCGAYGGNVWVSPDNKLVRAKDAKKLGARAITGEEAEKLGIPILSAEDIARINVEVAAMAEKKADETVETVAESKKADETVETVAEIAGELTPA